QRGTRRLEARLDLAHGDQRLLAGILALNAAFEIERGRARHEDERSAFDGACVKSHHLGTVAKNLLGHGTPLLGRAALSSHRSWTSRTLPPSSIPPRRAIATSSSGSRPRAMRRAASVMAQPAGASPAWPAAF